MDAGGNRQFISIRRVAGVPGAFYEGEILSRAVLALRAKGSWKIFLFVFDTGCRKFPGGLLKESPLRLQFPLGIRSIRGGGKLDVLIEVSKLAIIKVDLMMQLAQKEFIAPGRRIFHGTSFQKQKRAVQMTALLDMQFVSQAIRTFSA